MKKINQTTTEAIRDHVNNNPECTYQQVAASFGVSEISVERICGDLGRGKNWRRGQKSSSDHQKFWANVDRDEGDCWEWRGSKNNSGYGFVYHDAINQAAHRVAIHPWEGPISAGLELDHRCRNRLCCNPDHLEQVTRAENMKRVHMPQPSEPEGSSTSGGASVAGS